MRILRFKYRNGLLLVVFRICTANASDNAATLPENPPLRLKLDTSLLSYGKAAAASSSAPASQSNSPSPPASARRKMALNVQVNGEMIFPALVLYKDRDDRLFANKAVLEKLRIKTDHVGHVPAGNESLIALDQIGLLEYTLNEANQSLDITVTPEGAHLTRLQNSSYEQIGNIERGQGWFVNYDVNVFGSNRDKPQISGFLEGATPLSDGLLVASAFTNPVNGRQRFIRNQTYWNYDLPERKMSLRIGDSLGRSGGWGRGVPFAGIQWGTNYALQPYEIPFGLPTLSGQAASYSNVDIFVNGVLQSRKAVPYGSFEILNIPASSGAGEISAVVKDLDGNERRISLPYYIAAGLLKEGSHDYHVELGFPRDYRSGLGNDYGKPFAVYGHRYGFSSSLTAGVRLEGQAHQQTAGASLAYKIPFGLILETSLASSNSSKGTGHTASLGLEKSNVDFSARIFAQTLSTDFRQIGLSDDFLADRFRLLGSFSFSPFKQGGLAISHSITKKVNGKNEESSHLQYRFPSFDRLHSSLLYSKFYGDGGSYYLGVQLNYQLDTRNYLGASVYRQADRTLGASADYSRIAPPGNGYGYQLSVLKKGSQEPATSGYLLWRTDKVDYSANAGQNGNSSYYRLGARGSMVGIDDNLFFTREINDSFALVKIGNYANVRIMHENNPIATTNQYGTALVPNLRPYEINKISFKEEDLPLNVSVTDSQQKVTPRFKSGALVNFSVKSEKNVLLKIPAEFLIPLSSRFFAVIEGHEGQFPLSSTGEVYLPNLEREIQVSILSKKKICSFTIALPKTERALVRLGQVECN